MKNQIETINECMRDLNDISEKLKQIWPDDRPSANRGDDDIGLFYAIMTAKAHIMDLHCDLDTLLDYIPD